ncbi:MAG: hypothetical protein CSB44_03715 [Gammaproteobacteria bacterium]|nr:MAG: hypothetical protein CSB44_03715 [Gammaproteobacteria bacterium]
MLSIISGIPGAGKTLYTLQAVERYRAEDHKERQKTDPEAQPRVVYQYGIPGLKLDWVELERVEDWWKCPVHSIIVIDEAQQHFPTLSSSAKRPEHYNKFDVHRHSGFDIWLVTQNPANIDTRVTSMCGSHTHLFRPMGMERATVYQWPSVQRTTGRNLGKDNTATRTEWSHPKELYEMYKSAEVHTHRRTIPWRKLAGIAVLILCAIGGITWALSTLLHKGDEVQAEVMGDGGDARIQLADGTSMPKSGTIFDDVNAFAPTIDDIPMSAPIYAPAVDIVDAPRVDGCMALDYGTHVQCTCNDQRGNVIDLSERACQHYIENGWFDPTKGS